MICAYIYFNPVEKYPDYRNRTTKKHLDIIANQLRRIKECSLKPEDKKKLLNDMKAVIDEQLKNNAV